LVFLIVTLVGWKFQKKLVVETFDIQLRSAKKLADVLLPMFNSTAMYLQKDFDSDIFGSFLRVEDLSGRKSRTVQNVVVVFLIGFSI